MQPLIRPPGGQDEEHLIAACIRCGKCMETCPRQVIVPAHLEDGIVAMRTPTLDFSSDYCDFCARDNGGSPLCVTSCPVLALSLPPEAKAEQTIIGKAEIVNDWCLAYRLTDCRFCFDACPYKAIELDEMNRPAILPHKCNGCGACESACVSFSNGSITSGATTRAVSIHPARAR